MDKLRNTRILGLIGIVGLVLGTILPYITFSFLGYTQSISLWGYWEGKIIFALTLANLLFIFKDYVEKYVPKLFDSNIGRKIQNANNPKFSLVPTILVVVFAVYLYNKLDIAVSSEYLKYGLGFWSLWIGVVCLVGHAILYKQPKTNMQQPVNNVYAQPTVEQQPVNNVYAQPTVEQQPVNNVYAQPTVEQQPINNVYTQPTVEQQPVNNVYTQPTVGQQPVNNINQTASSKFCPSCGTKCDATVDKCFMCGRQF